MLASIQSSPAKIDRPQGDLEKELNSGGGTSPSLDSTCRNSAHSDSKLFNHYLPKLFAKHRPPTSSHTHSHNRSHTPSTPTTAEIQGCQRSHSITFKTLFRRPTPKPNSLHSLISNDTHDAPQSEDEETLTSPADGTSQAATESAQRSQKPAHPSSPQTLPKVMLPTDLYRQPDDDERGDDDDEDDDPVGSDAHVSHRMQPSERAPSLSSPPSMISAPPAYAMRNLKYQDLESLNDFGSDPAHPESHVDDNGGGQEEDERLSSQQARNGSKATPAISLPPQALRQSSRAYIDEESVAAHASVPVSHLLERAETREPIIRTSTSDRVAMLKSSVCSKWMPHPLSLETYTSIATSPGPMCDINSSADSQPPCSAQGLTMSADEVMASPARRLHRFLHAASTGKMLALSQLQGESEHLQPVEEITDRGQDLKHNSPNDRCKRSCQTSSSLASENMSSSSASSSSASTGHVKEDEEEDEGDLEDDNAQNVYSRDQPIPRYSQHHSLDSSNSSPSRPPSNRESLDLPCARPRGRPIEAQQRPKCQISMSRSRTPPVLATPREIEPVCSRPSKTPLRTRPATPISNTSPTLRPRPSAVEAKESSHSRHSTLKSPMAADHSMSSSNRSKHESSPQVDSSGNGPSGSPSSGAAFPLASPSISSSANFPISSPFLQWMVQSSSNAQAVCSNESPPTVTAMTTAKSASSKIVNPYVRRQYDGSSETTKHSVSASPSRLAVPAQKQSAGLGRMSPVAEESEAQADATVNRYGDKQAPRVALQSPSSAGQKSSSHFETANEEFISAQETQDGEGGGHGPIVAASASPAGHDQPSAESPGNVMRGTEKETVMVKSRGGETTGDSSSADRKRHKSPVQRIVSALTKRLFTAPDSQSRSSPSTDQWGKSNEQSSVCRERIRRQEKMKHAMARVLDEPRSPEENSSEASGFDLRETCNDLKLRCFPKILTPVRASTCTGTTRAASQQTTARHRHVSTFSQPTPPSSRLYNPHGESPPTCSCRLGPSSAGDTSSLGNSLKFALPQPRTASSIGASSWRRYMNGPMVVQSRGAVMSSRPCSSSSSYQSTDSSMRLLSPPKGGMRTLVGVFSAVEDAALKKYYDCLEDLKRRGDPLATTFSNEMSPPMDVAYYERRDGCARCSQCKWHGEKTFLVRDRSIMTDDTTQDRSTAEACMEVVEDGSTSHSEDDDDDYSDDEEYRMFEEEWLSSRGLLDDSIHSDDIRVGIPPMCVLRRGCAMMNDESRDMRQIRRHSKHYLHTHDVPHYRQTLYAIKSAPAIPRDTLLTEEEAERRLRRFLSHVVMKRRLKRIKLLQDSATKIQRWYRAQRQLSRFTGDETLSLESSVAMSSPRLLPPPKHKILPDGRILNVPRASPAFVGSVEKRESGSRRSGRHTAGKCDDLVRHTDESGHNTTWVIKARSAGGPRLPYPPSRSRHSRDGYCANICSRGGVYNVSEASRSSRGDIFRGGGVKVSDCTSGSLLTEDEWASELESCLWRNDSSYGDRAHHRERDIAVRVYPRPPVKVTMNRISQRRF